MGAVKSHPTELDCGELDEAWKLCDATDGYLLKLYTRERGAAAERAFAVLVSRHGPRVLRVCRRALGDEHEAEDALQVTFLLLAKKAEELHVNRSLAPWLHAVACRVTADARKATVRRRDHQRKLTVMGSIRVSDFTDDDDERAAILHEEIGRLSAKLRSAVVLCDLDGLSHQRAAAVLGWPVGTVKSRQSRGRERLRHRLSLRGFASSAGALVFLLHSARTVAAEVSPAFVDSTARAAVAYTAGGGAAAVSTKVLLET
jgi:RNA polymerase sigma factor (sigma-70 family)